MSGMTLMYRAVIGAGVVTSVIGRYRNSLDAREVAIRAGVGRRLDDGTFVLASGYHIIPTEEEPLWDVPEGIWIEKGGRIGRRRHD